MLCKPTNFWSKACWVRGYFYFTCQIWALGNAYLQTLSRQVYSSPMYHFNLLRHSNCAILEQTSWLVLNPMPSSLVATQCLQVIYLGFMTNSVGHTKSCVLCTFHNNIACHYSQVGRSLRRTLRSWKLRFLDQSRRPLEKICERVVACNMMFLDCGVQSTPDWIRPVSF